MALATLRSRVGHFMEGPRFNAFIITVIVLNAITLGLETSDWVMARAAEPLHFFDKAVLVVFVVEMLLKLFAFDLRYFKKGWNLFDFTIVVIALMPATGDLSVLRSLRVLRVLRLIAIVPSMRKVVQALLTAIPGVTSVIALMTLVYYVFAVMTTKLFGAIFPQWFGTIGESMYSLFQIMTLESWSMGIVRPVMEKFPWAWAVFVPFIMMTTFAVMNLFIAVIVNAMTEQSSEAAEAQTSELREIAEQETEVLLDRMDKLTQEMTEIRRLMAVRRI